MCVCLHVCACVHAYVGALNSSIGIWTTLVQKYVPVFIPEHPVYNLLLKSFVEGQYWHNQRALLKDFIYVRELHMDCV